MLFFVLVLLPMDGETIRTLKILFEPRRLYKYAIRGWAIGQSGKCIQGMELN
jgi:hypothetical protein